MSMERIKGAVVFSCDAPDCFEALETGLTDLAQANEHRRDEGWIARQVDAGGEWIHLCPTCKGSIRR